MFETANEMAYELDPEDEIEAYKRSAEQWQHTAELFAKRLSALQTTTPTKGPVSPLRTDSTSLERQLRDCRLQLQQTEAERLEQFSATEAAMLHLTEKEAELHLALLCQQDLQSQLRRVEGQLGLKCEESEGRVSLLDGFILERSELLHCAAAKSVGLGCLQQLELQSANENAERARLLHEAGTLRQELSAAQTELNQLLTGKRRTDERVAELEGQIQGLHEASTVKETETKLLEAKMERLQQKLVTTRGEEENLRSELHAALQQGASLRRELQDAQQEISGLRLQVQGNAEEITELQTTVTTLSRQFREREERHQEACDARDRQIETARFELEQATAELQRQKRHNQKLQDELTEAGRQIAHWQRLAKQGESQSHSDVTALANQLAAATARIQQQEDELTNAASKAAALQRTLQLQEEEMAGQLQGRGQLATAARSAEVTIQRLQGELAETRRALQISQEQADASGFERNRLLASLRERDEELQSRMELVASLTRQVEARQVAANAAAEQLAQLNRTALSREAGYAELEQQLAQAKRTAQHKDDEIRGLSEQKAELTRSLRQSEKQVEEMAAQCKFLKSEAQHSEQELALALQRQASLEADLQKRAEDLNCAVIDKAALVRGKQQQEEAIAVLQRRITELKSILGKHEMSAQNQAQTLLEARLLSQQNAQALEDSQANLAQANFLLKQKEEDLTQSEERLSQLRGLQQKLEVMLAETNLQLTASRHNADRWEKDTARLASELEERNAALQRMTKQQQEAELLLKRVQETLNQEREAKAELTRLLDAEKRNLSESRDRLSDANIRAGHLESQLESSRNERESLLASSQEAAAVFEKRLARIDEQSRKANDDHAAQLKRVLAELQRATEEKVQAQEEFRLQKVAIAALQAEYDSVTLERNNLEKRLKDAENETEGLRTEVARLQVEARVATDQAADSGLEADKVRREFEQLLRHGGDLRAELDSERKKNAELRETNKGLTETISELEARIENDIQTATRLSVALGDQLNALVADYQAAKSKGDELERINTRLAESIRAAANATRQSKELLQNEQERNRQLELANATLESHLRDLIPGDGLFPLLGIRVMEGHALHPKFTNHGVRILEAYGPAAKAGLWPDDVLVGVSVRFDIPVTGLFDVNRLYERLCPGDSVTCTVLRGGLPPHICFSFTPVETVENPHRKLKVRVVHAPGSPMNVVDVVNVTTRTVAPGNSTELKSPLKVASAVQNPSPQKKA